MYEHSSCSLTWGVMWPSSLFTRGATCLSWVLLVVRVSITASLDRHFSLGIFPSVIKFHLYPAKALMKCVSRSIILCWTLLKVHRRFTISNMFLSLTERIFSSPKILCGTRSWSPPPPPPLWDKLALLRQESMWTSGKTGHSLMFTSTPVWARMISSTIFPFFIFTLQ